ncbi:hypothetical protein EV426DRAFT_700199 [Tirmania nivea]|nr:hypothetical protein EV426DRAFT_700199 [Tirmania nivea]
MPPVRNHKRSNSFSGNGKGTSGSFVLPMQTKSKRCISFYEDPDKARAEQQEEDAAIERATRAFEPEAAKQRLLDEMDLREFARGVFRREYRAQKLDRWREQIGLGIRRGERDHDSAIGQEGNRARSMSPIAVGMETPQSEVGALKQLDDDEAMETDDDENPKPQPAKRVSAGSKSRYRQRSYNFSSARSAVQQGKRFEQDGSKGIVDLISIPHAIQRRLLKTMNSVCLTAAFNFTKKHRLPLTLNINSPSPKITRLTIHALTDAIIAAYNNGTIPPESVWEDIAFGFVGVFEAAGVLDDAVLYFKMRLSDRRMCAVLLAGVDLLQSLRDEEGVKKGEAVLGEAEKLIEAAKEGLMEHGEEDGDWDEDMGEEADGEQDEKENVALKVANDGNVVKQEEGSAVYQKFGSGKVDANMGDEDDEDA